MASGLYVNYRAAALVEESDIPYREWLHYFKRGSGNPFGLSIRSNRRKGERARLCEEGILPLDCDRYENEIGLWAAAEYGGDYTYFRLFTGGVMRRWFGNETNYAAVRPGRRVGLLIGLGLRTVGESRSD